MFAHFSLPENSLQRLKDVKDVGDGRLAEVLILRLGQLLDQLAALGVIVLVAGADEVHRVDGRFVNQLAVALLGVGVTALGLAPGSFHALDPGVVLAADNRHAALHIGHLARVGHLVDHRVPALLRLRLRLVAALCPADKVLPLFAILRAEGLVDAVDVEDLQVEEGLRGARQTAVAVVLAELLVGDDGSAVFGQLLLCGGQLHPFTAKETVGSHKAALKGVNGAVGRFGVLSQALLCQRPQNHHQKK